MIQNATSRGGVTPALIIQRADPWPVQPAHQRHPGAPGFRPSLKRPAGPSPIAWRTWPAAGPAGTSSPKGWRCGMRSQHRCRLRHRAGRVQQGNNGVPWVGGGNAGGSARVLDQGGRRRRARLQPANGRSATDTSSIARSACGNRLTCQTRSSPRRPRTFATRVLGEREQRTCETARRPRPRLASG